MAVRLAQPPLWYMAARVRAFAPARGPLLRTTVIRVSRSTGALSWAGVSFMRATVARGAVARYARPPMPAHALLPFWAYYGGKWRSAPRYPAPVHGRIIEPFAGAAGYAMR